MSLKNLPNQMEEEATNSLIVEEYDDRIKPKTLHEKRKFSKLEMRK
jgi:hypothetical protein